jgi:hypothetical protein
MTADHDSPIVLVLDQFAALRSYSAAPAVGGYRVMTRTRRAPRRLPSLAATLAALAKARMRLSGFFAVMFVGGLGLAVLAGPASCPCTGPISSAEAATTDRLGYVDRTMVAQTSIGDESELPMLSAATLVDHVDEAGSASITTATLGSGYAPGASGEGKSASAGRLPRVIEELRDQRPEPVRVAAATVIISDVDDPMPSIALRNASVPSSTAAEAEHQVAPKKSARSRTAPRAYRAGKRATQAKSGSGETVKRAPRWAQQMYVTPWQNQAFSYTR